MIPYPAMLDVPRELVTMLARRLRAERRARGTRTGTRALTCWKQALMVLVWYRKRDEMTVLATGFGISRATAYRYRDEAITALAAAAPDLHEALEQVAEEGWAHTVLDGKLFRTDRAAATTTSQKGETINSWYSGKHHQPGGLVSALMRPNGFPIWIGDTAPGPGSGGRREFHPPAPTDPGVTVSGHRALVILLSRRSRPNASAETGGDTRG